jgi:hypothetical protein
MQSCAAYCHLDCLRIYGVTSHMQTKVVDGPQDDNHTWAALHYYIALCRHQWTLWLTCASLIEEYITVLH